MARLGLSTPWSRSACLLCLRLRDLPAAADLHGIPKELDEAARVEGASAMQTLWRVRAAGEARLHRFALVSVSY
jgi:ABC-type Fe3+ transport system permease subunit